MHATIVRSLAAALALCVCAVSLIAQGGTIVIAIDAAANRHPINPNVYGVAHASAADLNDLNVPLNRNGGNNTSRYNWQLNADNRGNDWYYESIGDVSAVAGERGDSFIAASRAGNASAMLTVPTIEWIAKLGPGRGKLASFSVAKYGAQTATDWQCFPDAGNGVRTNGQYVTGNDPNDANVPSTSALQQAWVQHLVDRWGTNASGGLRYYILDNEPSIWHGTHRDVRPVGATMAEIRDKLIDYAGKIKAIDPSALVVGPEEWGWSGYFYSGYDQQYGAAHGWGTLPDRTSHGGADYLPWLLDSLRQNNAATGARLLDAFTVHYYPQSGEFSDDVSAPMQQRRNRSTRSLWDPSYVDESWIADRVQLIPRLKGWVAAYYPGTQTGITEYNWGAESTSTARRRRPMSWGSSAANGSTWPRAGRRRPRARRPIRQSRCTGTTTAIDRPSGTSASPPPETTPTRWRSLLRSTDGALTVMVVNKVSTSTVLALSLVNFSASGPSQLWQLTAANAIARPADVALSGQTINAALPPQSITLFVVPGSSGPSVPRPPIGVRIVR